MGNVETEEQIEHILQKEETVVQRTGVHAAVSFFVEI